MNLITTTADLGAACERMSRHNFVTVDTEFLRETTYYPLLCVAQMAIADEAVVIDALAEGLDLAPFFDLMANEGVLKVFHAARQDIEIVWHQAKLIPHPVFDTQVAAMAGAIGMLFILPWLDTSKVRSMRYRPTARIYYAIWIVSVIALGFPWKAGDRMVGFREEFPANYFPWKQLEARGVSIDWLSIYDPVETIGRAVEGEHRRIGPAPAASPSPATRASGPVRVSSKRVRAPLFLLEPLRV